MSNDDGNIIQFGQVQGGKQDSDKKEFPEHPYVIVDVDNEEYYYDGYLIFTTHHVCIMVDGGEEGPVTGFMMPMNRIKLVSIADEDEETAH